MQPVNSTCPKWAVYALHQHGERLLGLGSIAYSIDSLCQLFGYSIKAPSTTQGVGLLQQQIDRQVGRVFVFAQNAFDHQAQLLGQPARRAAKVSQMLFDKDEAQRQVLVFGRVHVGAQLVGHGLTRWSGRAFSQGIARQSSYAALSAAPPDRPWR